MRSLPIIAALIVAAILPARAADPLTPVVFHSPSDDWRDRALNEAIDAALTRASFNRMAKPVPDAVVISIPDGFGREGHEDKVEYSFTAIFFRNGDKLGESLEGCKITAVAECADQLAADARSAAALVK